MRSFFLAAAAFLGATAVSAGAFGAHALRGALEVRLFEVFQTAAQYQMYHALALLGVALLLYLLDARGSGGEASLFPESRGGGAVSGGSPAERPGRTAALVAGWAFLIGVLIFSGTLYLMVATGVRWLGAITPFGGTAMIVGWIALLVAALRAR